MPSLHEQLKRRISLLSADRRQASNPSSEILPFSQWLPHVSPELIWDHAHLKFIRRQLADVTLGTCRKLAIAWPPQHFKTFSTTVRYPLWRMLREPGLRVGIGTYNQRYANKISRWTRRLVERLGLETEGSIDSWSLPNGSSYIARGSGVGLAGTPVDLWICLPGDTQIHTQLGLMRIDDIVTMGNRPPILTYNHATCELEYKSVTGASVTYSDQLLEFTDDHARTFRCTANHRVYTREHGYIRADQVACGDTLLAVEAEAAQGHEDVSDTGLRGEDGSVQQALPNVSLCGHQVGCQPDVFTVPFGVHQEGLQCGKERPALSLDVLFDNMQQRPQPRGTGQEVRGVRQPDGEENQPVLRPVSQDARVGAAKEVAPEQDVRPLLADVYSEHVAQTVLLSDVFRRGPFDPNAGRGQLPLQDRDELQSTVPQHEAAHCGAGRGPLYLVRTRRTQVSGEDAHGHTISAEQLDGSPHRRGRAEQHCGQPRDSLHPVPSGQPPLRVSARSVRGIRTVRGVCQPVYDLTVEGNRNFFANGTLVHNCDDPFKNREQADSQTIQEKVWEWHMDDVTPRIQQGGQYILIQTRWNAGDLIGRVLRADDRDSWRFVRIPAIAETLEERNRVHERLGLPLNELDPLNREPGAPLCSAAFDAESLADKRRVLGVGFESLYQQDEVPRGGSFFQRDWFESVAALPDGAELVRYWDLAASRKDSACYTSGVLMGRHGTGDAKRFYVVDVVRGRWMPAERNEIMLQTARADKERKGFKRTWFEEPVFDKDKAAARAVIAKLAGYSVSPDKVSGAGSKELRAEPLAGAAKAGLVKLVDGGSWKSALLTELEGFPRGQWKDQVDSSSGAFNKLSIQETFVNVFTVGSGR